MPVIEEGIQDQLGTDIRRNIKSRQTTITSAQMLALNASPITVVPAPGAGKANIPVGISLFLDFATTAYAGIAAGEDLSLKYTDASGQEQIQVEATGFLDAGADAHRYKVQNDALKTPVANAALVLHMLVGEIITGDSSLEVEVFYFTVDVDLP